MITSAIQKTRAKYWFLFNFISDEKLCCTTIKASKLFKDMILDDNKPAKVFHLKI